MLDTETTFKNIFITNLKTGEVLLELDEAEYVGLSQTGFVLVQVKDKLHMFNMELVGTIEYQNPEQESVTDGTNPDNVIRIN
jgi:hypothetical protein